MNMKWFICISWEYHIYNATGRINIFSTWRGSARVCFSKLRLGSLGLFAKISKHFVIHFIKGLRNCHLVMCLLVVRQNTGESLRNYVDWFKKEALHVDEVDGKVFLAAFMFCHCSLPNSYFCYRWLPWLVWLS